MGLAAECGGSSGWIHRGGLSNALKNEEVSSSEMRKGDSKPVAQAEFHGNGLQHGSVQAQSEKRDLAWPQYLPAPAIQVEVHSRGDRG